ncbi:hypothetical protein [Streptomyces sp. MST-110588]|uniref:hypothetical protein n=1 Tax=Streptomyces sp. MST-110588 TaxID=2833628 RepID=UPI001F5E1414|nr:hypothetical protein [Streptomyces sp. MST-110588]UNO40560.1 hypothetical protein KGS77_14460 [Streptomyces sp. MST-110588]
MSLNDDDGYGSGGYAGGGHAGGDYGRTDTGQTRTRLPDGGSQAYGGARRSRTGLSSRNLITVVGVVVLLIAAIAFANRGGGTGGGDGGAKGDADKGAQAQSTAPTGEKPVKGKDAGIATGFARTEQGAQSAAANYVVALTGVGMYEADKRRQIIETVYAPSVAAARKRDLDKVFTDPAFLGRIGLQPDGTAPKGGTFVSRSNPVGTKIEAFQGDSAKVAVWYSALFGIAGGSSKNPVTESWFTNTFDLKWVDGDWKVVDFTEKNGPAPIGQDQAASSAEEMSKAVEGFGGFTYAR